MGIRPSRTRLQQREVDMHESDKPEFFARLNGIMECFGKPKVTQAAAQVWWDTIRDQDHNDVLTVLGYWAQGNSKPPTPRDIWGEANNRRTDRLETKAAQERAVNRGDSRPDGYAPTEYGRRMSRACVAMAGRRGAA